VPRNGEPVTFLDDDGALPGGTAFGRVLSHDDDLSFALADLDLLRASKGERGARRWIRAIADGDGAGYEGPVRLLTVLPRAHRLRTGSAMPGYRSYQQEESAVPGARDEYRVAMLEVEHDGVRGLIALEVAASSAFQLEDLVARRTAALQSLLPFAVVEQHLGAPIPETATRDPRRERDGVVLFRGALDAPPADEAWVAALRAAMSTPARRSKPLPGAEVWATIESAGPGDPDLLAVALAALLVTRTPSRIRAFDAGLRVLLAELDTPELLEAASESFGWLSDDAWEDVRLGVIARGAAAHADAIRAPEAFDWASVEPGEALLSAASDAHEERTDERIEPDDEPSGVRIAAVVLSARAGELCLRRWADATTARARHAAAEGEGTAVLAVRRELDRARLPDALVLVAPGPLL
jgi:hypothetical protein